MDDFGDFFNFGPVVLPNAAPGPHNTTGKGNPPDAQYTQPGQAGLRYTMQEILN